MRKHPLYRILAAISLTAVSASCSKEAVTVEGDVLRTVELRPTCAVKSSYVKGASAVVWSEGDRMSVLDGMANREFFAYQTSSDAIFKGSISSSAGKLTIVYPYYPSAMASGENGIIASLPEIQWAVPGTVSDESLLSVGTASSSNLSVEMKNVVGFVSFTLPCGLEDVSKVEFSANGGENIAGEALILYDGKSDPEISRTSGSSRISLCTPFEKLAPGDYYLAALPGTLSSGFTLTFHRADGRIARLTSSKSNTIKRNRVLGLGLIDAESLKWEGSASAAIETIEIDFSSWPFDEPIGNQLFQDRNVRYVTADGKPFDLEGTAYYSTVSNLVISSSYSSLFLPGIPGRKLVSVLHTSDEASPNFYFTDKSDKPVSGRDFESRTYGTLYRINGSAEGEGIKMKVSSPVSLSKLTLTYEVVKDSPRVTSVSGFDGSKASFAFEHGKASDFVCGISYLPACQEDWSKAETVEGEIVSSSSSSSTFAISMPSGNFKARAWARPASGSQDVCLYGPLYFSPDSRRTIIIDFASGDSFSKYGTIGGDGTLESPRTGLNFPTSKQEVTNQTTGATSNDGGSLYGTRSGTTKYWSNYPITHFSYAQAGSEYHFLMGTAISLYDAYLYIASGKLFNNKARFSFPGISGYKVHSVTMNVYGGGDKYYSFGSGSDYENFGDTSHTPLNGYKDIFIKFPEDIKSGIGVNARSSQSFQVKKITIEYVKE